MQRCAHHASTRRAQLRQRGVIVFIALIVLVAMTLAALALIRSTDTGNVIAGNLAFKQSTANASDAALEGAYRLLLNADALGTAALSNDNAFPGYWSSQPPQPEVTTNYTNPAWFQANGACAVAGCAPDANGNVSYYVVHRMCTLKNLVYNGPNNLCATLPHVGTCSGGSHGTPQKFPCPPDIYYRVTTLIVGPKNTQSVVQAMVALANR
jgi:Tfp pilus assembly protein PilX